MNTNDSQERPGPGCAGWFFIACFMLSVPVALFDAWHAAIFLILFGTGGMLIIGVRRGALEDLSDRKQNVALHREIHASETVYRQPNWRPRRTPQNLPAQREIPLSEYPPCVDPVTGHVSTYNELREKLLGKKT